MVPERNGTTGIPLSAGGLVVCSLLCMLCLRSLSALLNCQRPTGTVAPGVPTDSEH